ncbi:MAG: FAD-dependent oxidoreductase [Pseudomonadota bacterium]
MKTQTRAVVIGGGIAGCSTLYHLTTMGWTDVVMVERDELTSGTTWHSAAQVTNFGPNQTMVGLKTHSINLYKELAEDPEYPINYHHACGGIRLAATQDHLDGYHHFMSMAKGMGVDFEVIDAAECKKRHPLIETHELLGALWDPLDGDIDPAQLCQALARRARKAGAEVYRHTPVVALTQKLDDSWIVHVHDKDGNPHDIHCEVIVNACGYRVNEVAAMYGMQHPVASMEHQYFLTDPIAELEAMDHKVPLIRDPLDDFYSRQEKNGLLVGIYEQGCKTWGMDGIDPGFANALCPNDLDRCLDNMERVFKRLPCLEETGIHTVINGPITYTADGLPLVGKIPGKRNAYCIIGLRAGLGEGGGHGWLLAQIITQGEACYDTWCLDPRRMLGHATVEYTALKAIEDYQNEFRFHMPHEHRPAGRMAKTTPLYATLKNQNVEFGVVAGWERASFFKPGADFVDEHSFRFTPTKEVVAAEVNNIQNNVGIMEVSGFNRFEISGEGAADWLDSLTCSRTPARDGKVGLCYSVGVQGNVLGEFTLARFNENRLWFGSAAAAEFHDWDWLNERKPEGITLENLTHSHTILVVAGPKSRALLQSVAARDDFSQSDFPWLSVKNVHIDYVEVTAMSVSFSGELAWELHIPNASLLHVYQTLTAAGENFGLKPFGLYATESMRLEKGYLHWKSDLISEYTPFETGLDRFVKLDKTDFEGKALLEKIKDKPKRRQLITMILNCDSATAHAGDSILIGDKVVGTVTSAGWGFRVEKNIVFGFVDCEHVATGTHLSVELLGRQFDAEIVEGPLYDSKNVRLKA